MGRIADIYSTEIDEDPFPTYAILREEYPCFWMESAKAWILTRYSDVQTANQDWQTYSSTGGNFVDEIPGRAGATLGTTDPPRHDRLRNLAQAAFLRSPAQQRALARDRGEDRRQIARPHLRNGDVRLH